jgi:hypothetical protein
MEFSELAIYISFIGMKSKMITRFWFGIDKQSRLIIENVKKAREKEVVVLL